MKETSVSSDVDQWTRRFPLSGRFALPVTFGCWDRHHFDKIKEHKAITMIYPLLGFISADAMYIYISKGAITLPTSFADFLAKSPSDQAAIGGLAGASALLILLTVNKVLGVDPLGRTGELMGTLAGQEKKRAIKVDNIINQYNELHDDDKQGLDARNSSYTTLVNAYYELATLFYEWGWGQSFHFAYQLKGESFNQAIARHEYYLAGRLGVKQGDKVLDVGCGIGGPLRNIARFTRADITGVTLNEYQVLRGNALTKAAGLSATARLVQQDFMKLNDFKDNSFDGVYAIEATCHAPKREVVYGQIFRVLKPGQVIITPSQCIPYQHTLSTNTIKILYQYHILLIYYPTNHTNRLLSYISPLSPSRLTHNPPLTHNPSFRVLTPFPSVHLSVRYSPPTNGVLPPNTSTAMRSML